MATFNGKIWNDRVFQRYMRTILNTRENSLIKNGLFRTVNTRTDLRNQVGGNYFEEPIRGLLDGTVQNYDGVTTMVPTSRGTFKQGKIIIGRMKAWKEDDFTTELTGVNWMQGMAQEVRDYYDGVDQDDLLAILEGIFNMTDTGTNFVANHTYEVEGNLEATSLVTALQKACGDKRSNFSVIFVHSFVAANLEGKQLVEFLKYTDAQGLTRSLTLYTWNGKLVVEDDGLPTETVEATETEEAYTKYTSYVFGTGFFGFENFGAKVPSEVSRVPDVNGGYDALWTRQRKMYVPQFISFTKASMKTDSPEPDELKNGANWEIVNNGLTGKNKVYVDDKMIPLARIISRG